MCWEEEEEGAQSSKEGHLRRCGAGLVPWQSVSPVAGLTVVKGGTFFMAVGPEKKEARTDRRVMLLSGELPQWWVVGEDLVWRKNRDCSCPQSYSA